MSAFKKKLAAVSSTPLPALTVAVPAPELGEGEQAHVRVLSLGERIAFFDVLDAVRRKNDRGEYEVKAWEQVPKLLHLIAADADGSLCFAGADDPDVLKVPSPLAQRMIDAAVDACVGTGDDAKKPSAASGTRS